MHKELISSDDGLPHVLAVGVNLIFVLLVLKAYKSIPAKQSDFLNQHSKYLLQIQVSATLVSFYRGVKKVDKRFLKYPNRSVSPLARKISIHNTTIIRSILLGAITDRAKKLI